MALAVGLVLLVAMSLIAVSALRSAVLEERITSNSQSLVIAEQAADAALRAAEQVLQQASLPVFNGSSGYYPEATLGAPPLWTTINWDSGSSVQTYSGMSGAPGPAGQASAEFIIEVVEIGVVFEPLNRGQAKKGAGATEVTSFYRITSRGRGPGGKPAVFLESNFRVSSASAERISWRRLR